MISLLYCIRYFTFLLTLFTEHVLRKRELVMRSKCIYIIQVQQNIPFISSVKQPASNFTIWAAFHFHNLFCRNVLIYNLFYESHFKCHPLHLAFPINNLTHSLSADLEVTVLKHLPAEKRKKDYIPLFRG